MKLLIIEDDPKHFADANAFFFDREGIDELVVVKTFSDSLLHIKGSDYYKIKAADAVISDIHFPEMLPSGEPLPIGVAVMVLCQQLHTPCILNTDSYHHSEQLNWICDLGRELGWPVIVDCGVHADIRIATKHWGSAWGWLQELLAQKAAQAV